MMTFYFILFLLVGGYVMLKYSVGPMLYIILALLFGGYMVLRCSVGLPWQSPCPTVYLILLSLVCGYGWLPFLVHGIMRWNRGKGGSGGILILIASFWLLLLGVFFSLFTHPQSFIHISVKELPLVLFSLLLCSGWTPLFIWGIVRWCYKKRGGKRITISAVAWGLIVISFVSFQSHQRQKIYSLSHAQGLYLAVNTVTYPLTIPHS